MIEISKRIEALETELQKLKNEVKPKFEVGKWYKDINPHMIFNITEIRNGFKGYGLGSLGYWIDNKEDKEDEGLFYRDNMCKANRDLVLATDKEVGEALIKEAKNRGFKEGVKVLRSDKLLSANETSSAPNEVYIMNNKYSYNAELNTLKIDGRVIFGTGEWAEIVKDEPIMINGFKVEKIDNHFKIGCKDITRKELNHIKGFMERNNYVKVNFSNDNNAHLVHLETINKILAL